MSLMSPSWFVFYTRYGNQRQVEWPFAAEPKPSNIAVLIRNNPSEEEFLIPDMLHSATPDESAIKFFELNNISIVNSVLAPDVDPYQP